MTTVLVWFGYSRCLVFLQLWFGLYSVLIGLGSITAELLPMAWFVLATFLVRLGSSPCLGLAYYSIDLVRLQSWFGLLQPELGWLATVLIWSGYSRGLVFLQA